MDLKYCTVSAIRVPVTVEKDFEKLNLCMVRMRVIGSQRRIY
jgi:hypothetical protein